MVAASPPATATAAPNSSATTVRGTPATVTSLTTPPQPADAATLATAPPGPASAPGTDQPPSLPATAPPVVLSPPPPVAPRITALGPVEVSCTPDGVGGFAATLRLTWSDGHVETATGNFRDLGTYRLIGDRASTAFFEVRASLGGPTCDLGGTAHTLYWPA